MIELLFSVCAAGGQLVDCKEKRITFPEQSVTIRECQVNGVLSIAQWLGEHPNYEGWQIGHWTCGRTGILAKA